MCETWHDKDKFNKSIYSNLHNYNTISYPSTTQYSGHIIYIHQNIHYKQLLQYNIKPTLNNSTQTTNIEFKLPNTRKPYIFTLVYIQPTTDSINKIKKNINKIYNKYNDTHNIIIAGDFNLHHEYICQNVCNTRYSTASNTLVNTIQNLNLYYLNNIYCKKQYTFHPYKSILDLAFTNNANSINNMEIETSSKLLSDHYPITIYLNNKSNIFNNNNNNNNNITRNKYIIKNETLVHFNETLDYHLVNWLNKDVCNILNIDNNNNLYNNNNNNNNNINNDKYIIYCDGGARPNPGHGGCGVVIYKLNNNNQKENIINKSIYLGDNITNNIAEYYGLINSIITALKNNIKYVDIYMDSAVIINQVKGNMKCIDILLPYRNIIRQLLTYFISYNLIHVKRAFNKEADQLSTQAIKRKQNNNNDNTNYTDINSINNFINQLKNNDDKNTIQKKIEQFLIKNNNNNNNDNSTNHQQIIEELWLSLKTKFFNAADTHFDVNINNNNNNDMFRINNNNNQQKIYKNKNTGKINQPWWKFSNKLEEKWKIMKKSYYKMLHNKTNTHHKIKYIIAYKNFKQEKNSAIQKWITNRNKKIEEKLNQSITVNWKQWKKINKYFSQNTYSNI